jgi:diguanylate cyclase (GGDEF)-like protein/PAS domain S-box-containing protein
MLGLEFQTPRGRMTIELDGTAIARLEPLSNAAARATNAAAAAVVIVANGHLTVACRVGAVAYPLDRADALHARADGAVMFVAGSNAAGTAVGEALSARGLSFFASAGFTTNETSGYLCVFDSEIRCLSAAQEYVLRTFAASVADQLDMSLLRSHARGIGERLRLLESVVVNANDSVLITEAEPINLPGPRIIYANAAFTRATGFSLEDVIGKTPRILQGSETSPAARERLRNALATWTPVEVELVNYKKDGTPFWVELSIVPVADENGWWTHWVSVQRDVTNRKVMEEAAIRERIAEAERAALVRRAFHDDLTGMRNRAYFMDRLRSAMTDQDPAKTGRIAVLFLDLDRFKIVNDSLGHDVGDQLLIEIGRRLQRCVRSPDMLARIGGDEFTFLIQDTRDMHGSIALAERLLAELSKPIRLAGRDIVPGASIGICSVYPWDSTPENVLRNADIAMYHAKSLGGQRSAVFDPAMHDRAISTMQTEIELRSALAQNEFELHYQPLVTLGDGRIYGFESLVRWRHPVRGLIPPAQFISIAEDTGLIVPLGAWILGEACRQLREWEESGITGLTMNVNVSGRQLFDKTFRDELTHACATLGEDVFQLQLEITESVLLGRASVADELLQWVRSLGVRVAFDDFGTGFSSLSYLRRFKIDTLKIDASFIWSMAEEPANLEIVRMIVALGRSLGMAVVAEGVELPSQRDALLACAAERGQGYLFSKPVPAAQVPALLQTANGSSALA